MKDNLHLHHNPAFTDDLGPSHPRGAREIIQARLNDLKIPQRDLSRSAQIPTTTLSLFLSGHRKPSIALLQQCSRALGLDLDKLVAAENDYAAIATAPALQREPTLCVNADHEGPRFTKCSDHLVIGLGGTGKSVVDAVCAMLARRYAPFSDVGTFGTCLEILARGGGATSTAAKIVYDQWEDGRERCTTHFAQSVSDHGTVSRKFLLNCQLTLDMGMAENFWHAFPSDGSPASRAEAPKTNSVGIASGAEGSSFLSAGAVVVGIDTNPHSLCYRSAKETDLSGGALGFYAKMSSFLGRGIGVSVTGCKVTSAHREEFHGLNRHPRMPSSWDSIYKRCRFPFRGESGDFTAWPSLTLWGKVLQRFKLGVRLLIITFHSLEDRMAKPFLPARGKLFRHPVGFGGASNSGVQPKSWLPITSKTALRDLFHNRGAPSLPRPRRIRRCHVGLALQNMNGIRSI